MAKGIKGRRRKMWEKNRHCFWCGIETIWIDENPIPDDGATIDHIRSRHSPNRQQKPRQWYSGIWVLSCRKCNHERAKMEEMFLASQKPEVLHQKCGSSAAEQGLLQSQSQLCSVLLAFLRHGGSLHAETQTQTILRRKVESHANNLQRAYDRKKQERRAKIVNKPLQSPPGS